MTVKLLLLIYGRLDGRALRVGKPISSSARCQAFYSSLRKVHEHYIANCLFILSSALVVRVVQRATVTWVFPHQRMGTAIMELKLDQYLASIYVGPLFLVL